MKKIGLFLISSLILFNLSACGQMGPLYLPGHKSPVYIPHHPRKTLL